MKFSVLLPTRNRLEYLRYAVQTVLRQDYTDWELIISDNNSEEDIAGFVQSLNDDRVKYSRTDTFVPVTENWNNALDQSSGDYVIMLGDDDGLMQGYFTKMHSLIEEYAAPDVIYTSAFLYAYPGVLPDSPEGYLHPLGCADFLDGAKLPFWLSKEVAFKLVQHTMNFEARFDYNMQFSTINRKFIDSLRHKGPFFQSPFPDYYATNVAFLKAERILICPRPLVVIGITPKSYGFFHFNRREAEGVAFLKGRADPSIYKKLQHVLLPGTNMNTGWLLAAETIRVNFGSEFKLKVDNRRYRLLQIIYAYQGHYLLKVLSKENLQELQGRMNLTEKLLVNVGLGILFLLKAVLPLKPRRTLAHRLMIMIGQYPDVDYPKIEGRYQNMLEVFEQACTMCDEKS